MKKETKRQRVKCSNEKKNENLATNNFFCVFFSALTEPTNVVTSMNNTFVSEDDSVSNKGVVW